MLTPATLTGQAVWLEPLVAEHAGALAAAADGDRSSYAYTWVPDGLADAERYVQAALEQQSAGRALVHVVRRLSDDRIVGTTRFLDLELFTWPPPWPPGVARGPLPTKDQPPSVAEIGSTWYASSAQRSGVNLEVKLLQLTHAFERWQVLRVTLKTDARNASSRTAIERLGARAEGVRRAHSPASDGTVRDSAYYSILRRSGPTSATGFINDWRAEARALPPAHRSRKLILPCTGSRWPTGIDCCVRGAGPGGACGGEPGSVQQYFAVEFVGQLLPGEVALADLVGVNRR